MKKVFIFGMGLCMALAFASCKSSESAYKKAYEKAKAQEVATQPTEQPAQTVETVTVNPPVQKAAANTSNSGVTLVSGTGLKDYNVVCGSFSAKANAENLKAFLDKEGYNALIVYHSASNGNWFRVVVGSYDNRADAVAARDAFKARYPNREDFQGAWLLHR